jgi:Secretion system C-terminal sorting domain
MKARFTIFVFLLLFLSGLNAQTGFFGGSVVPLKPQSPLFGKDIVINDQPTQDQYKVALCSAFNGWQYAVIAYGGSAVRLTFLKSVDGGINWTIIMDGWAGSANTELSSMDILVSGDSVSNLKIIFSSVIIAQNDPSLIGDGDVSIFNEASGIYEYTLLHVNSCYDLAIASDYLYPAVNSNPHSIGILYSIYRIYGDSILFSSSSNGGLTLDGYRGVAGTTTNHFHKVALAYGRSQSFNSGKYFAVWEEQNGFGEMLGHIYTAHTNPNFNSPFTTPINIDGLDPAIVNQCQNPAIACQYNAVDNDSSNLTEVIMFEKYKPSISRYDIGAYYNLQACSSTYFKPMTVTDPTHVNLQPDLAFNPYDSTFMFTYYDTTVKKLPFLKTNFNLPTPNNWTVVNSGFNDSPDISNPGPKVELNIGQPEAMNSWIANRPNGNGLALFDAPYSTYTGVSGHGSGTSAKLYGSYPNPCSNTINIAFELKNSGRVAIDVIDIMGQTLGPVTDQIYSVGKHAVKYDVSDLPNGNYLYKFRSGEFNATGKFTVIR